MNPVLSHVYGSTVLLLDICSGASSTEASILNYTEKKTQRFVHTILNLNNHAPDLYWTLNSSISFMFIVLVLFC